MDTLQWATGLVPCDSNCCDSLARAWVVVAEVQMLDVGQASRLVIACEVCGQHPNTFIFLIPPMHFPPMHLSSPRWTRSARVLEW